MIYLDTCIVIYAVEDDGPRGNAVRQRLADAGDTEFAVGPLVTMGCIVGPLRRENLALHDHYLRALDNFRRLDLGEEHFMRAAQLRARHNLRTPDALHLAVAQFSGCEQLWTNDNRLSAAAEGLRSWSRAHCQTSSTDLLRRSGNGVSAPRGHRNPAFHHRENLPPPERARAHEC